MLLAVRVLWLILMAAAAHFQTGLAYPTLLLAALIGWRGWRPYWVLPLIIAEAVYASDLFAHATGSGKLPGAMSNVFFQLGAFSLLALVGLVSGHVARGWRRS